MGPTAYDDVSRRATGDGLTAPAVFDRPMDGPSFLASIEQILVPTLTADDIVIMDNLSCHQSAAVRRAIEDVGATLSFLQKYSPDLNPIEHSFAKLQAILRKALSHQRRALGHDRRLVSRFEPAEYSNDFRHCGYSAATGL